jgi:hypothetical protein
LFETQLLDGGAVAGMATGDDLTYITGQDLVVSRNGYLMPRTTLNTAGVAVVSIDVAAVAAEVEHGHAASTTLAILKMPADAVQPEIVYDQRV